MPAHNGLVLQDADTVQALANFRAKKARGFSDCRVLGIARKAVSPTAV